MQFLKRQASFLLDHILEKIDLSIAKETLFEAIKIDKSSTTIMELIDRLGFVRKLLANIDIVPQK